MSASRHIFVKVAECLSANHAPLTMVQDFADMFAEVNPRFNRPLFIQASTREIRKDAEQERRALDREGVL